MFSGYTFNDRAMISLGIVDPGIDDGDVLTLIWGEEGGGTDKTTVEPHKQTEIRVRVTPAPYSRDARSYTRGWRTRTS
jgi:vanillate/3-O-methylgallate O-demethylase